MLKQTRQRLQHKLKLKLGRKTREPLPASSDAAASDTEATSDEALAPIETLHDVEREMDLADWIDPQTGTLAEGGSPPRINEE